MTKAGPGGVLGGLIWGSAVDGKRVYVANAIAGFRPWNLVGGATVDYGFWSARDASTSVTTNTTRPVGIGATRVMAPAPRRC